MDLAGLFTPENLARARKNEDEKKKLLAPVEPVAQAPAIASEPAVIPASAPPAEPDAPPAPAAPQKPIVVETVDTTTTTGTQSQKPTKDEANLLKNQEQIFADQQAQAAKAAEAGRQKAIADAAQADEKARITSEKAAQTDAIVKDGEKLLADRLAESDRVYNELKSKADIKDYWESQSTGNKILAGLGIALGGIGAGMAGHSSNRALDVINKAIEQDFARQRANFENARAMASESREQTQAARQSVNDRVNMLNLSKAAAYDTLADKYAAMAAKRGVAEADLAKDAVLLDLRAKQNAARMEYEKGLRQTITSQTQRKVDQTAMTPSELAGKSSEAVSKFQTEIQGNKDFDAWKKKRGAKDSFTAMKEAGASGAALVDFIAGGLQQGSFGPEMVNLLSKRNLVDRAGNVIRENVVGGFDPALMGAIENGLKAQEAKARRQAAAPIARARTEAKRLGLSEDYFTGTPEAAPVEEKVVGGKRYRKVQGGWEEVQ